MNTTITWKPTFEQQAASRIGNFSRWLREHRGLNLPSYREMLDWSITDVSGFWGAVTEFFDIIGSGFQGPALSEDRMPGAVWYPDAQVNYAENILRPAQGTMAGNTAVTEVDEDGVVTMLSWAELEMRTSELAGALEALGVVAGDRVVAVLPNTVDAVVGLLAATSLGAIWSISSPELSVNATLSRLRQLEPSVLIGIEMYRFNGKQFDSSGALAEIEASLPSLRATLIAGEKAPNSQRLTLREAAVLNRKPKYQRVSFSHPLWVLFSSGTTGAPKGIVHGHGGMLLEALKNMGLNQDLGPQDVFFVAANTSWMVWNTLVNTLATGASIVCYPGSATFGQKDRLFKLIADLGVTMFATGAAYLTLVERTGAEPGRDHDLQRLRSIMSTGSPLQPSTWAWVHTAVSQSVHLGSDSGGTDICSGFIGSNPLEPVILGEIQGPELGVAVEAWDQDGTRTVGSVGEMVILRPMPSMPLYFWGDPDGSKYHDAYFDKFPGAWAHGDWITETDRGGFIVHGRSDATLNRDGVRLGSSEIYAALQYLPVIQDSLVIGVELPNGKYYFPLFITLADSAVLSDELKKEINSTIRRYASPRHVPDEIIVAPAIPTTHTGKKVEIQVKKLFAGVHPQTAINRSALANPESIDWFITQSALSNDQ